MTNPAAAPAKAGLEDVVVSTSEICFIDGHLGRLLYRGFDVDDLVAQSSFEEVVWLLWHGRLPTRKELEAHNKALSSSATRKLPPKLLAMLKMFPKKTTPMEVLRTGVSALSAFDPATGAWKQWKLPGPGPKTYAVYVDDRDKVWLADWGANALVRFDPGTEKFDVFPFARDSANVRQIHGRPGEILLPESGPRVVSIFRK